jgi:dolichol kinase
LFPPREYAVAFPAILVLVGGSGVAAFIGRVMMKEARKRRIREGKAA